MSSSRRRVTENFVGFRITPDEGRALDLLASRRGMSRAALARTLIRDFLEGRPPAQAAPIVREGELHLGPIRVNWKAKWNA